ncbi:hypothetical protein JCM6882_001249 [Rhodosporidiobolus microsporus]
MDRPKRSTKPIERYGAPAGTTSTPPSTPIQRAAAPETSAKDTGGSRGAKRSVEEASEEEDEELSEMQQEDEDEDDYDSPPPAKRARRSIGSAAKPATPSASTQRKGRKGKLSAFAELPMDVIFLVAAQLDPYTIVSLSRTTRALRAGLLAKSGEPIWKAVREGAGMPQMTTGKITDREVVLLYVDKKCMMCHAANGPIVDYMFKVRFCKPCQLEYVQAIKTLRYTDSVGRSFAVDPVAAKLFLLAEVPVGKTHNRTYTFVPSARALHNRYKAITGRSHISVEDDPLEVGSPEFVAFHVEQTAYIAAAAKDAQALRTWFSSAAFDQYQQARTAENSRVDAVRYNHKISHLVHQPRPLTDAIWKRISADVVAGIEEHREERIKREAERKLQQEKWERDRAEAQAKQLQRQAELRRLAEAKKASQTPEARAASRAKVEADLAAPTSQVAARYAPLFQSPVNSHASREVVNTLNRCISNPAVSLTQDEYGTFFAPYLHYIPCRLCHPSTELFSFPAFVLHKAERHGVVDAPATSLKIDKSGLDRDAYYDGGWSDALIGALRQAGLPEMVAGDVAIPQLEAFGEAWSCESGKKPVEKLKWSDMVKHIRTAFRGAAIRVSGQPIITLDRSVALVAPAAPAPPVASSSSAPTPTPAPIASTSSGASSLPARPAAPLSVRPSAALPTRPSAPLPPRPVMPLQARQPQQQQQSQVNSSAAGPVPNDSAPRRPLASYADLF